jgi:hypothetical protein
MGYLQAISRAFPVIIIDRQSTKNAIDLNEFQLKGTFVNHFNKDEM